MSATNSGDGETPVSFSGIPDADDIDDLDAIDDGDGDDTDDADGGDDLATAVIDGEPGAAADVAEPDAGAQVGEVETPAAAKAAQQGTSPRVVKAPREPKAVTGRATPKGGSPKSQPLKPGRYTPPIPKEVRRSPAWYPYVLLTFLIGGLLMIVLNYIHVLPGGTSNWYLLGGIALIIGGLFMATRYH